MDCKSDEACVDCGETHAAHHNPYFDPQDNPCKVHGFRSLKEDARCRQLADYYKVTFSFFDHHAKLIREFCKLPGTWHYDSDVDNPDREPKLYAFFGTESEARAGAQRVAQAFTALGVPPDYVHLRRVAVEVIG